MFQFRCCHARLARVEAKLDFLIGKEIHMAGEIDKLESDVAAEETVLGGVTSLLSGLKAELDAAIAANDMSRVSAVSAKIEADTAALSAAVVANTPVVPAPPSA